MSKDASRPPLLHIYPPRFPGEAIEIIGRPQGLDRLIYGLIRAIEWGEGEGTVRTCDGSISEFQVTCLQGDSRVEDWHRSDSPLWDIDDPLVARIVVLVEEVRSLRETIAVLRQERRSNEPAQHTGNFVSSGGDPFAPG